MATVIVIDDSETAPVTVLHKVSEADSTALVDLARDLTPLPVERISGNDFVTRLVPLVDEVTEAHPDAKMYGFLDWLLSQDDGFETPAAQAAARLEAVLDRAHYLWTELGYRETLTEADPVVAVQVRAV